MYLKLYTVSLEYALNEGKMIFYNNLYVKKINKQSIRTKQFYFNTSNKVHVTENNRADLGVDFEMNIR